MFFVPELLTKRGALFHVWIAATQKGKALQKYLPMRKVREQRIELIVEDILRTFLQSYPSVPQSRLTHFSLYLSSQLLFGSCVVLHKQASVLQHDICEVFKNIKLARWSKEKNALVFKTAKKATPKSKSNEAITQSAVDDDDDEVINWIVISESDVSYFDDDGAPLTFPNSVPPASITMREDFDNIPSHPEEDMRFGDEDVERHPVYSLPVQDIYGKPSRIKVTEIFDEDVRRDAGNADNILEDVVTQRMDPFVLFGDENMGHGTGLENDQQLTEIQSKINAATDETQSGLTTEKDSETMKAVSPQKGTSISDSISKQITMVQSPLSHTMEQPATTDMVSGQGVDSADDLPPPQDELNTDLSTRPLIEPTLPPQVDNQTDFPNEQATSPHPYDSADEPLILPELPPTPKPTRKRRRLAIDEIIKIPDNVFDYRIRVGSQDTIQPRNKIPEAFDIEDLTPLRRTCRVHSKSLKYLVERHFRTQPMPTMDLQTQFPGPTTQPDGHSSETDEYNDLNLATHSSPNKRAPQETLDERQAKSPKLGKEQEEQPVDSFDSPQRQSAQHDTNALGDPTPLGETLAQRELAQNGIEEQPHQLFDSPQRQSAQHDTNALGDLADREQRAPQADPNLNVPSSPSPSIAAEGVLSEIETKLNMENHSDISFQELYPPATTKKREAGKKFAALLGLQVLKKVHLNQQLDGVTVPPLLIKRLN